MEGKLHEIQSRLKAPKTQYNNFGKYKYRTCEDILEAVKPILGRMGLSVILSESIINIGNRFYVASTATLMGDSIPICSTTAFAREAEEKKGMDAAQVTGAATSYARKFALAGLFAIDDNEDADGLHQGEDELPPKTRQVSYKIEEFAAEAPEVKKQPPAPAIKEKEIVDPGAVSVRPGPPKIGHSVEAEQLSIFNAVLPDSTVKAFEDELTQRGRYYLPLVTDSEGVLAFVEEANKKIMACEGRGPQDAKTMDAFLLHLQKDSKAKGKGKSLSELKEAVMSKKTFEKLWEQYCDHMAKP